MKSKRTENTNALIDLWRRQGKLGSESITRQTLNAAHSDAGITRLLRIAQGQAGL